MSNIKKMVYIVSYCSIIGVVSSFVIPSIPNISTNLKLVNEATTIAEHNRRGDTLDDYVTVGDLKVPAVGIGTIAWSSDSITRLESYELQRLVDTAVDSNAAFFDTAERYGSNIKTAFGMGWGETERLTGLLLSNSQNDQKTNNNNNTPIIATKFTPTPWRTTVESVIQACQESCDRLGVDQIDLYQLHMPDIVQPFKYWKGGEKITKDEIYWQGLIECYKMGLVKNVGVCNYGSTLVRQCHDFLKQQNVPLASNQIAYSILGRQAQNTVDTCQDLGVQVLAFFPFAMGLLTGKYNNNQVSSNLSVIDDSLLTSKKSNLEKRDLQMYAKKITPLLNEMQDIANARGKALSQIALNYIISKGVIPIPGARTQQQLIDNIGAMGWRLSNDEINRLENIADNLGFAFEGAGFKRASEKFVGYGMERWVLD